MRYENYVKKLVAALIEIMSLQEWEYTIKFDAEMPAGDYACVHIDTVYLTFTIQLAPAVRSEYWQGQALSEIAKVLVHELAHLFTYPLYEIANSAANAHNREFIDNIDERQTCRITTMVLRLLPKKVWTI